MIKYIFSEEELKCLFVLSGFEKFICPLMSEKELTESEVRRGEEGLIEKNVLHKVSAKTVRLDLMFERLIGVLCDGDYSFYNPLLFVAKTEIVVALEKEQRSHGVYKLIPFPDLHGFVTQYEITNTDTFCLKAGNELLGEGFHLNDIKEMV